MRAGETTSSGEPGTPPKTPRVLFLDHVGVLSGAELSLLDIARRYACSGKVVLFADGPFRERLERAGVAVEVLPAPRAMSRIRREGGGLRELGAAPGVLELSWRIARLARGYDLIYANSQKALVVGSLAGELSNKPVIWHLRDMLTEDHFSRRHRRLAVALANRLVARVIANSTATAEAFVGSGGDVGKVRVVYNGIDPTPFERPGLGREAEALREDLRLPDGAPVVGAFSRLAPWKGQHVLLEALAGIPGVHALLVGDALFGESGYAESLRKWAGEAEVADRVRFLGFREDVPLLMRLTDVVVHTSVAPEPFGRMIVEGMLAGRPVVASRSGGALEIIEDGVDGVLVAPGDSKALSRALSGLLSDPSRARALAEAGRETASGRFSLRAMQERVAEQIREVAGLRRRRGAGLVGRVGQ